MHLCTLVSTEREGSKVGKLALSVGKGCDMDPVAVGKIGWVLNQKMGILGGRERLLRVQVVAYMPIPTKTPNPPGHTIFI